MLNKNNNSHSTISLAKQDRPCSQSIDSMMRDVLHTLKKIDFQHDAELERLEISSTDDKLKSYMRGKLFAKHRARREPYVELLAELRKHQHRPALMA